jgi:dihydropteroate synthase
MKLITRSATIEFPRRPLVMGIVNLCADSFSGDGIPDPATALSHAQRLIGHGAEIIDIGAESAGTQRAPMSEQEETDRLCAMIQLWHSAETPPAALLSINTWRPKVARAALALGGDLLNDLGGLPSDENARVCRETGAALLIMHTVGEPKVKHTHVRYEDVMASLEVFFAEKLLFAQRAGLIREATLLDPGLDFAKQRDDNLRILRSIERLQRFQRPILLPVSRKTMIGETLGIADPAERDAGTVACVVAGMKRGANIFRVHNVRATVQAIRAVQAVFEAPGVRPKTSEIGGI